MDNNITFKKALFGGFDREDVMNYIASVTDEFFKYKKETVKKLEEMKEKTAELETAYSALLEENNRLKVEITQLSDEEKTEAEDSQPDIKKLIESLTESMNVLISVLSTDEESDNEESDNEAAEAEEPETEENNNDEPYEGETEPEINENSVESLVLNSNNSDSDNEAKTNTEESIDDVINRYS